MPTVTTAATTLDSGSSGQIRITNDGAVQATVSRGREQVVLWPQQSTVLTPDGLPVTARTADGTTTLTVAAVAADAGLPGGGVVSFADLGPDVVPGLGGTFAPITGSGTYGPLAESLVRGPQLRSRTDPNLLMAEPAAAVLTVPTPSGNNEITHPSVVYVPGGWQGWRYWMAATPYEDADPTVENPCIYRSQDGSTWTVPTGVTNPLVPHPGGVSHNSDTHLVLSKDGSTMNLVYRFTDGVAETDVIRVVTSTSGTSWTAPVDILTVPWATEHVVSPAVIWDGTQWVMFYVSWAGGTSDGTIKRRTCPTLTGTWSAPASCTVTLPSGRAAWHINAGIVNDEIWLLVLDNPTGSPGYSGDLYLATSLDGLAFTCATAPLVARYSRIGNGCYRSAFLPIMVDGGLGMDVWQAVAGSAWKLARVTATKPSPLYDNVTGLLGGTVAAPPYVAADGFARADGTSGLGTTDSGKTWTGWAGAWGISSRQAYSPGGGNTAAVFDSGIADGYFEADVRAIGTQAWLIFRGADDQNYWRLGFRPGDGGLLLQKYVADALSSPFVAPLSAATTGRVGVRCAGPILTVFLDGRIVGQCSDASHQTATKVGLQTSDTTSRIDSLWVRSLVGGK